MNYQEFLKSKTRLAPSSGFEVSKEDIHPLLHRHQPDIVQWALRGGCRAIFAAFGLGKTLIQLEILRLIESLKYGCWPCLIVLPLGVKQEFQIDAVKLGMDVRFIRKNSEIEREHHFYITNYESVRDGKVDPNLFQAASLDEASVLRSYGSETYQKFLTLFDQVPYKFVATATPSPNRYKELIHYAGFLGIMDTGQALTRFFQRDSTQANNLTLLPSMEEEFWLWLSSWAVFIQKPSDLGYSDEGYDLPELEVVTHEVPSNYKQDDTEKDGQGKMFRDTSMGVQEASKEKADTIDIRISKMKEIIDQDPDDHMILWHDLEAERRAIKREVPDCVEVYGALDLEKREERIIDFSNGKFKYLGTKPVLSGSGCNFQRHCHRAIFPGIGFKFHDFIQAVHRILRFMQKHQCRIDIIYTEAERGTFDMLMRKWEEHKKLVANMQALLKEHGLNSLDDDIALTRSIGVERQEVTGKNWKAVNNDCVVESESMQENSVGLIVTSIPFANHYEYTESYNDFGHTTNNGHFWKQMDFLTPQMLRVLQPGRIYACHVKDRINFGSVTGKGVPTSSPFHAEAIFHAMEHGFDYLGMITVVTDVVRENNQTYRLGWSEQCKDGTKMGVGSPEYILLFRKPQTDRSKGFADVPVVKSKEDYSRSRWQVDAHALWRSSGDRRLTVDEFAACGPGKLATLFTAESLKHVYNYEDHVRVGESLDSRGALPASFMSLAPGSHHPKVWTDVNRMLTMNGEQTRRGLNNHVCPLQFDIVDRLITRYSNEGDVVCDFFAGLYTVPCRAVKLKRVGWGVELNTGYWKDGGWYLRAEEAQVDMPTLFKLDSLAVEAS